MRFGVVVFPGTWSDTDTVEALRTMGQDAGYVWHQTRDVSGYDALVLPGGFSYGDYLRCGAIARFSPVMEAVKAFAGAGGLVIGICNGFQVLCEAGLLPGVLLRNESMEFRCQWTRLRVETADSPFTNACTKGRVLRVPISHGEGNYFADEATLATLEREGLVAFRYCAADGEVSPASNPNGSVHNIAGIMDRSKNVLGMMPHPERAVEALLGSEDGRCIFQSMVQRGRRLAGTRRQQ